MFAYFRNREQHGHRRTGSTPTTPSSPQLQSPPYLAHWPDSPSAFSNSPASARPVSHIESPISPLPPVLPPIPRIASTSNRSNRDDAVQGERSYNQACPAEPMAATMEQGDKHIQGYSQGSTDKSTTAASENAGNPQGPPVPQIDLSWSPSFRSLHLQPLQPMESHQFSGRRQPGQTASTSAGSQETPLSQQPERSQPPHITTTHALAQRGTLGTAGSDYVTSYISPSSSAYTLLPKSASSVNLSSMENSSGPYRLQQTTSQTQPNMTAKSSKSKLNLLNPVSLLMRRRSSQVTADPSDVPLPVPRGMDFHVNRITDNDYRPIKGNIVHDFNAPRSRRLPSGGDADDIPESASASSGDISDSTPNEAPQPVLPEKSHFVEDFSESTGDKANASAIQRESLANQAFLARASRQLDTEKVDLPPPSRTPPVVPQEQVTPRASDRGSKETINTAYRESLDKSTVRSSLSRGTRDTSPEGSPPRAPSPGFADRRSADIPRHMASTASRTSRFSFQMHSESSREQEQALEEKHKKRMGSSNHKPKESVADSRFDELEEEDMSAYDDIDMDGEDDVPYIGDDSFSGFSGTYPSGGVSPGVSDFSLEQTTPSQQTQHVPTLSPFPQKPTINRYVESASQEATPKAKQIYRTDQPVRNNTKGSKMSDDMYFDDGDIDLVSASDRGTFDESVFDMSPKRATYSMRSTRQDLPVHEEEDVPQSFSIDGSLRNADQNRTQQAEPFSPPQTSTGPSREPTQNVQRTSNESVIAGRDGHLHAYHQALASAATRAATDGKFSRNPSTIAGSSVYDDNELERLEEDDVFGSTTVGFDDYDDDMDEDPLIAAANAEALSVDEAGFYGQEFGFYRSGGGESFNGGYWGNPNDNRMIGNAIMEPNLTPITERSEFSNRNSFISLHGHSASWDAAVAPSPGLREIAAGIEMDEDDMTLGQLMRLRKEAFAGASASRKSFLLPASGSSGSSPTGVSNNAQGYVPPSGLANHVAAHPNYQHSSPGGYSTDEDQYEEEFGYDSPNSPTINVAISGHRATASISDTNSPPGPTSAGDSQSSPGVVTSPRQSLTASLRSQKSDVPIINPPRPPSLTKATAVRPPSQPQAPIAGTSPPTDGSAFVSPVSPPMPSSSVLEKFASRPSPDAYRRTSYQFPPTPSSAQQTYQSRPKTRGDRDSVAYVQENAEWYLERRRTTSTGEVIVVGRELVEGGRI